MFQLVTTSLFALFISFLSVSTAVAAPSKGIFRGDYDGITNLENVVGDRIFYSPVRFKITKAGKISGTAFNTKTQKLLKVSGKINSVNSLFGVRFIGKASGRFSDGTTWTAEIEANRDVSGKIISGKARKGAYTGTLSLTNL